MHFWPTKQIIKSSPLFNVKKILANRPKGISDETWKEIVKDEKMNKLIILDQVPKASKKSVAKRSSD